MPALASHSLALLAVSRGLRLLMWTLMCIVGEWEYSLMLADGIHVYLLWDFIRAYVRSRRGGTSDLILATRQASGSHI